MNLGRTIFIFGTKIGVHVENVVSGVSLNERFIYQSGYKGNLDERRQEIRFGGLRGFLIQFGGERVLLKGDQKFQNN